MWNGGMNIPYPMGGRGLWGARIQRIATLFPLELSLQCPNLHIYHLGHSVVKILFEIPFVLT